MPQSARFYRTDKRLRQTGRLMDDTPDTRWLPPLAAESAAPAPLGPAQAPPRPPLWRRLTAPLVALGALLAKFKGVIFLLPKLKLLATFGSMGLSVAAYALIWGWPFAAGFVALLFIHESGHVIQMRREGVKPSWMVFVPFMGAAVGARSLGGNALAEARIGLAGPILGSLAAGAVYLWGHSTGSELLIALAYTGFFLNLFNLLPIVPLDGGRAMAAMSPWMWGLGFAGLLGLFVYRPNPLLAIILLFGGLSGWRRFKERRKGLEGNPAYYRVAPLYRFAVGLVYVALIALLVLGMHASFVDRSAHITG
jgi:Zn-dependent protease